MYLLPNVRVGFAPEPPGVDLESIFVGGYAGFYAGANGYATFVVYELGQDREPGFPGYGWMDRR